MQRLLLRLSVGVTTAVAVGLLALLALSMSPAGALALRGYALTASGLLLVSGPNAQDNCEPASGPATGPVSSVTTGLPPTGGLCCPPPATGPATEPATGPVSGPPNPCGGLGGGGPGTGPATGPSTGPPPGRKCEPEKDKKADKAEADRAKHDKHKGSIADLPNSLLAAVQRFLDSRHHPDRDCDNDQDSEDTGGG